MKAVVLAGGLGTRLHPLTINIPKPMIPVANQPIMEYTIELLAKYGFKEIVVLLYHQPHIIKNYFGDGTEFGVKITYIEATENYGTAGAVKFAAKEFDEPFLVISADLITDFNLKEIADYHLNKKAALTIVLTRVENPLPFGIVITSKDGRIKHFLEKPSWSEVFSDTVNTGIYLINPKILNFIPPEKEFDFSHDLFPILLEKKEKLFGMIAEGLWKDIGSIEEYVRVHSQIMHGIPAIQGRNVKISKSARIEGVGVIGDNTIVADEATILNSIVGNNCQIHRGAYIRESVIWDNVVIGPDARLERTIVGENSEIADRAYLEENSVIADDVKIGKDAKVRPLVKIWPGRVVEEGATVSRSMVLRERSPKTIFGPFGVTGLCNVELTPEFAASLGAAYGAMLGKGSFITTSRDSHKASRMIYRALLSGVLSAGVNVSDLEMTPVPVTRYELKALKSKGGFHVRKSPYDPEVIDIKFFDEDGMDLQSSREKKIERLFFAEDFKRIQANDVGELNFPFHRVAEKYKEGVLSKIDCVALRGKRTRAVIDYAYGSASQIFPSILGESGCDFVALNAYLDETKITKTHADFELALKQLSAIVTSLNTDMGIMLDAGAEKVFISDEKGRVFSGDDALSLVAILVLSTTGVKKPKIAVPVNSSSSIDKIAEKYKAQVVRCKSSSRNMMETASRPDIIFLGERTGGFIFPEFQPHFDAMFTIIKILELVSKNGVKLSNIEIPPSRVYKKDVSCLPELKGKVLRTLIEEVKEGEIEMIDGVKVRFGEDWILILPHPVRPIIELYAECAKEKDAQKLLSEYTKKIDEILS